MRIRVLHIRTLCRFSRLSATEAIKWIGRIQFEGVLDGRHFGLASRVQQNCGAVVRDGSKPYSIVLTTEYLQIRALKRTCVTCPGIRPVRLSDRASAPPPSVSHFPGGLVKLMS